MDLTQDAGDIVQILNRPQTTSVTLARYIMTTLPRPPLPPDWSRGRENKATTPGDVDARRVKHMERCSYSV